MSLIPDHDGELERMRRRKSEAAAKGSQAFLRPLKLAQAGGSRQVFPCYLYDLRRMDVAIGGDMLACLGALRWPQADLHTLVPDGVNVSGQS